MDALKGSLAAMQEMFHTKMNEFQLELHRNSSSTSSSTLPSEFSAFRTFILAALDTLQKQVEFLARELDHQEMRGRRKILLFHGVPENKSENTSQVAVAIISEKMKIPEFSSEFISRSHRLGRPSDKKPRPIVVKFRERSVRDKVWFAKAKLKGSGVTQSEFLTRPRHDLFVEARRRFGVSNCWTRQGWVQVLATDGSVHQVECVVDLDAVPCAPTATTSAKTAASGDSTQTVCSIRTRRMLRR